MKKLRWHKSLSQTLGDKKVVSFFLIHIFCFLLARQMICLKSKLKLVKFDNTFF